MALTRSIEKALTTALSSVGLSFSETKVLLALLQNDKGVRASDLARGTRLNRTTLYGVAKSLIAKGLVSAVEERGVLRYRSLQPEFLVDYIERAKKRLESGAEEVKKALPLIQERRTHEAHSYPAVRFFEGKDGIKQVYEDTVKANKSKTLYGFLGADAGLKFMGYDWIHAYIASRKKYGVKAYTVATDTPALRGFKSRDADDLRSTKLLPPGYEFELELVVYDDKVLIASFKPDRPLAVLIEDTEIAKLMKAVFRYIDKTLPE